MTDQDVQDLHDDLDNVDDDDDEDEFADEDQISSTIIDLAESMDIKVSDYETEAQVSQAIKTSFAKIQSGDREVSSKKEEQIELAALKVLIDDDENELDPRLKKAFEKFATTSNENNVKITKMLEAKLKDSGASGKMQKQLDQFKVQLAASDERYWIGRQDAWINDDSERQKYFGKGRSEALDQDGKYARRRRVCFKEANKFAARQTGKFTAESMFKKGHRKMAGNRKSTEKSTSRDDAEGTALSRADGGGQKDYAETDKSAEALKRKAHEKANKIMRTRG